MQVLRSTAYVRPFSMDKLCKKQGCRKGLYKVRKACRVGKAEQGPKVDLVGAGSGVLFMYKFWAGTEDMAPRLSWYALSSVRSSPSSKSVQIKNSRSRVECSLMWKLHITLDSTSTEEIPPACFSSFLRHAVSNPTCVAEKRYPPSCCVLKDKNRNYTYLSAFD